MTYFDMHISTQFHGTFRSEQVMNAYAQRQNIEAYTLTPSPYILHYGNLYQLHTVVARDTAYLKFYTSEQAYIRGKLHAILIYNGSHYTIQGPKKEIEKVLNVTLPKAQPGYAHTLVFPYGEHLETYLKSAYLWIKE